jgi:sporulation protein YlmC with PRC-barrel domain
MLKLTGFSLLAMAFALPALAASPTAQSSPGSIAPVAQDTAGGGVASPSSGIASPSTRNDMLTESGDMRASQIIGSPVYNDKSDKIGSVGELVISNNRSLIAIIDVGGVMGIGSKQVAMPFERLEFVPATGNTGNRLVLPGVTKDRLAAMPD